MMGHLVRPEEQQETACSWWCGWSASAACVCHQHLAGAVCVSATRWFGVGLGLCGRCKTRFLCCVLRAVPSNKLSLPIMMQSHC